jgi:hypothetical protein
MSKQTGILAPARTFVKPIPGLFNVQWLDVAAKDKFNQKAIVAVLKHFVFPRQHLV